MSSHPAAQLYDEVPSSKLCSLSVDIRFSVGIPAPRARRRSASAPAPPPYSKSHEAQEEKTDADVEAVVRRGPVRVEECRAQIRSWYFKINWLVLTERHLALHGSANTDPRAIIPMSDIVKLDRTETEPYCLILETKQGKRYLLKFKNDDDLYDWQDAICSRFTGVSNPWSFRHNVHVFVNQSTGNYGGLPDEWRKLLSYSQGHLHPRFGRPLPVHVPVDLNDSTFLRITFNDALSTTDSWISTTLSVTQDMRLGDVLDQVCRKMEVVSGKATLTLNRDSKRTILSLDDTVADLQGEDSLELIVASD